MTIHLAGERAMLEAMLDVQRVEIAGLLDGLSEEEARARLVPSLTTPLALVKHATFVEKVWFHCRVADRSRAEVGIPDTPEESFVLSPADTVLSVRETYLAACEGSRAIAAEADLDDEYPWHHGPVSLRFVYVHMIQELARHAGQGDILVEQLTARRTASGGS
jgi:hypothetical protein